MSEKIKAIFGNPSRAKEVKEWVRSQGAENVDSYCYGYNDDVFYVVDNKVYTLNRERAILFDIVELFKPKLRPYNSMREFWQAEKEHGPWFVSKESNQLAYKAINITPYGIDFRTHHLEVHYDYSTLIEKFEWQDGTPCGILEGGEK